MKAVLKIFTSWRMFLALILGLASGFPLALTLGTLQAWMATEKVDLKTIGLFALVGLPYTLKFLWAPFMDRWVPPFLGRRRGWMLITQIGVIGGILLLAGTRPSEDAPLIALFALCIAFFSASQDIVIDAFRVEFFTPEEYGLSTGIHVMGYRLGMILSGSLALILSDHIPWRAVYLVMAGIMCLSLLVTFTAKENKSKVRPPSNLKEMIVDPFLEFFSRPGSLEILVFVLLYRVGDIMAAALKTPFLMQLGYARQDIGVIAKLFGVWATIGGTALGGIILAAWPLRRSLFVFGIFQALSTVVYYILTYLPPAQSSLALCVVVEEVTAGMGMAAYTTFLMRLCNKKFTATQFALLSSLMAVTRVLTQAPVGFIVEAAGWRPFFIGCIILGLIPLALLSRYKVWEKGIEA